jgi:deoxyribodipyrimidine photo-lyase
MPKKTVSIFWFRRDLRLHDNHGLFRALEGLYPVLPVFIFDKDILSHLSDKADRRVTFIHDCLGKMQEKLVEAGSTLHVFFDTPARAFESLLEEYDVKAVYTNHDYEPYAMARDKQIGDRLNKKGIAFHTFKDQVIFERSEVMKGDGTPYTIFTPYSRIWKQKFRDTKIVSFPSEKRMDRFIGLKKRPLPSLADIGFSEADLHVPEPSWKKQTVVNYDKTRNFPSVDGTTRLSVHLRFGTVSVRKLAVTAAELSEVWLNELIWREFFMMILFHFPAVIDHSFKRKYDNIKWRNNEQEFDKWCRGETGYAIVDAGMRELNETGFMHNRVRMVVASFLTKHLLIDWRWGEAYFAEKLLDYELSSNNGNWQWAAGCGCDAAPYFRVFNPYEQEKKFDPDRKYIKKWLGADYHLNPMVDHVMARKRALEVYKAGVEQG